MTDRFTGNLTFVEYATIEAMNASQLKTIYGRSLLHWRHEQDNPRSDTEAFGFGRACHTYVLEGVKVFEEQYTVADGPINDRTGNPYGADTAKYRDWLEGQEKPVVSRADFDQMMQMNKSIRLNSLAANMIDYRDNLKTWIEVTGQCTMGNVPCKVRLDILNELAIIDLKTCKSAKKDLFVKDMLKYGYDISAAFYVDVSETIDGNARTFHFIAVEKSAPYCCCVYTMSPEWLEVGRQKYQAAMKEYQHFNKTGEIRGYPNSMIEAPAWA